MPAGNIADIGVALQSAKGVASASAQHRVYLTGGGVAPDRTVADVEETSGTRLRAQSFVSQVAVGGEPSFAVRPASIGLFLYAAMGAKAVTGAADPYTHTFTLALTQPWLTVWRMLGGTLFERFVDCKLSSLNFESGAGGILTATAGIVGLTPSSQTSGEAIAVEGVEPFTHMDGKGQFVFEGVTLSRVSAMRVNIGTGVEADYGDGITADGAEEGMIEAIIETEQTISDFALWNRFHYGTAVPADNAPPIPTVIELGAPGLSIKYTKRQASGAAATPERSLEFTATKVQIAAIEGQESNTDGSPLTRTVRYRIVEPASGSGLTAVLKNGQATYPAI